MQFLKRNSKTINITNSDKMNKDELVHAQTNYASAHHAPHDALQVSPNLRSG